MSKSFIKWYYEHLEEAREINRKYNKMYREKKENKQKIKERQAKWWKEVGSKRDKEKRKKNKEINKYNKYQKDGYIVELKKDNGNKYFFFIIKDKKVIYISEKFVSFETAKREMMEAV